LPEECARGGPEESLEGLFRLLEARAIQAADWYLQEKKSKARWSRGLRFLAIVLASAGGLVPLMALGGIGHLNPAVGYLLLGGAAATVAFDRLFGFSSAWMRYMTTAMTLERLLVEFQLEWARSRALAADADEVAKQFDVLDRFGSAVASAVEEETVVWASEFGTNIHGFETRVSDHSKGS